MVKKRGYNNSECTNFRIYIVFPISQIVPDKFLDNKFAEKMKDNLRNNF